MAPNRKDRQNSSAQTNHRASKRRRRRFRRRALERGFALANVWLRKCFFRLGRPSKNSRRRKAEGPPYDGPSGEKSSKANARMAKKPFYNRQSKRRRQIKSSGKRLQRQGN